MELNTVEIPRTEARQSYLDYRRAAKLESDVVARRELKEMARAFRIAAQEDLSLIALTPTIHRGGTIPRTRVEFKGMAAETRMTYLLPRLAVIPARARFVYSLGVQQNGSVEYLDELGHGYRYTRGRVTIDAGFELPSELQAGRSIEDAWTRSAWSAMVPIVPPKHRPRSLSGYLVLWEADDWTWAAVPPPPHDPALLKHVGGDIYAVVATWDLTELEKLVLSGRELPVRGW